jgi:hypothetical protein
MSPDTRDAINDLSQIVQSLRELTELQGKVERLEERAGTDSDAWRF